MQTVFDKLKENLQVIYRKGVDADKKLDDIQQLGKGKYSHVFTADSGFNAQSKRFAPYIEELAQDIVKLESAEQDEVTTALPEVIKKMELMFSTLAQLDQSLKSR